MKKLLLVFSMLCVLSTVNAQSNTFQAFKLDIGGGLDVLSPNSASLTFTLEPHYRLADNFALGLRFQGAVSLSAKQNGVGVYVYSSNCASADYYVTDVKQKAMMFVGGGLGVFTEQTGTNSDVQVDNFGFFPRVGVEVNHFRASLEYNVTGGVRNYFSINAAWFIWGGRK